MKHLTGLLARGLEIAERLTPRRRLIALHVEIDMVADELTGPITHYHLIPAKNEQETFKKV